MIKGTVLSVTTVGGFMVLLFTLGKATRFSFVDATYDGNFSNSVQMYGVYYGRTGFCLVIFGLCVLYGFTGQLYKIPSETEIDIFIN